MGEPAKVKRSKKELKEKIALLREKLASQQQQIKEAKLPVLVLFEGPAAAGKGGLISDVIRELDPRYYSVASPKFTKERFERYPFLHRYFSLIPENGQLQLLDSGWMQEIVEEELYREITRKEYKARIKSINSLERQLRDNGYVVIKFFLDISEQEQWCRMTALMEDMDTTWRVEPGDLWQHAHYDELMDAYSRFMEATQEIIPWYTLNGDSKLERRYQALKHMTETIDRALENGKYSGKPFEAEYPLVKMPRLAEIECFPTIPEEEYDRELKQLQKRLSVLHNKVYRKRIPVVICYEGWDAAGKGGNIRRVSKALDPRGCEVHPIASPEPHELARHYLWRFWKRLPAAGHIAIFDRTWYGRVMVERLEGYCGKSDWKRAYNEINEFEAELTSWGVVLIKFWLHIDPDTQLARFTDRQNTPAKQWKITEEDWRNREKWPQYEAAVDEMLEKTSTTTAPWHIIESNDKRYARIKAMRIIIKALEDALASNTMRGMSRECLKKKEKGKGKSKEKARKKESKASAPETQTPGEPESCPETPSPLTEASEMEAPPTMEMAQTSSLTES